MTEKYNASNISLDQILSYITKVSHPQKVGLK